ncbi:AGAMOUS-like 102 [Raphanus sativus]|nr:AGAMOUS-like 102 [Raphanus sativus]
MNAIFKKSNELTKIYNVRVDVLKVSPTGKSFLFKSPSSLKLVRIPKLQKTLNNVMKDLEYEKERAKVLKKRHQEFLQNYEVKEIKNMKIDEAITFRDNLKALQEILKWQKMDIKNLLSQKE